MILNIILFLLPLLLTLTIYVLVDPRSGNITDIFPTGRLGNALANFLPPDQILLLKESISILVGFDGKPTRKFGLSWSEPPTAIGI
jgi:hypothetical protein